MSGSPGETPPGCEGRRRALAAVTLLSQELARRDPNWDALRVLAARLLEICDRMDRGLALDKRES